MVLKIYWKQLILCLAVPIGIGGLSALLTRDSMEAFEALRQPPLSPPGWIFPVVWGLLYLMMGVASYLVLVSQSPIPDIRRALWFYAAQLVVNFFWSIIFFNLGRYLLAFVWLVLLWVLILITTALFRRISRPAGRLMLPYLLWVTFAGYLNLAIYFLNR